MAEEIENRPFAIVALSKNGDYYAVKAKSIYLSDSKERFLDAEKVDVVGNKVVTDWLRIRQCLRWFQIHPLHILKPTYMILPEVISAQVSQRVNSVQSVYLIMWRLQSGVVQLSMKS